MYDLNNIYKVDCTVALKHLADDSVDLVLTDIPYGIVNRGNNGLRTLDKLDADTLTFDLDVFLSQCVRVCRGSIYVFCGTEQVSFVRESLVTRGLSTRHCIWEKTNPSPMNGQRLWLSSIENCIFGKKKNAVFNEHCKSSVWRFPSQRSKIHPTQKPVALFEYLIQTSSRENDLVLDPCMGSGTTAVAALRCKRNYLGFDVSQEYVDAANARVEEERLGFCTKHQQKSSVSRWEFKAQKQITERIIAMGFDICGKNWNFHCNGASWAHLLGLGRDFGWKPMGTVNPLQSDPSEKWSGGYGTNDGQTVTDEDAANLADAIERALTALTDVAAPNANHEEDAYRNYLRERIRYFRTSGFMIY